MYLEIWTASRRKIIIKLYLMKCSQCVSIFWVFIRGEKKDTTKKQTRNMNETTTKNNSFKSKKKREQEIITSNIKWCTTHSHLFKRHNVHLLCKCCLALVTLFSYWWYASLRIIFISIQFVVILFSTAHTRAHTHTLFDGYWIHTRVCLPFYAFSLAYTVHIYISNGRSKNQKRKNMQ